VLLGPLMARDTCGVPSKSERRKTFRLRGSARGELKEFQAALQKLHASSSSPSNVVHDPANAVAAVLSPMSASARGDALRRVWRGRIVKGSEVAPASRRQLQPQLQQGAPGQEAVLAKDVSAAETDGLALSRRQQRRNAGAAWEAAMRVQGSAIVPNFLQHRRVLVSSGQNVCDPLPYLSRVACCVHADGGTQHDQGVPQVAAATDLPLESGEFCGDVSATGLPHLPWEGLPPSVRPAEGGGLPSSRQHRKLAQLEIMVALVAAAVLRAAGRKAPGEPVRVVEFCSGSGHIALPLAAVLGPTLVTCICVDLNEVAIGLAKERAEAAALPVEPLCMTVGGFRQRVLQGGNMFDVGVALHACGAASDSSMEACLQCDAAFVICPCCVGKVNHAGAANYTETEGGLDLQYPRSVAFRNLLSHQEYTAVASAADWHDQVPQQDARRQAKAVVEADRAAHAEECGYRVVQAQMPIWCTPKNDVLVGIPRSWSGG